MVLSNEQNETAEAFSGCPPIELITENGYRIVRARDLNKAFQESPDEYTFIVRSRFRRRHKVVVVFTRQATRGVKRQKYSTPALQISFRIECAERALADYLWKRDALPPGGRLKLQEGFDERRLAQRDSDNLEETGLRIMTEPGNRTFNRHHISAITVLPLLVLFAFHSVASGLWVSKFRLSDLILDSSIFLWGTMFGLFFADLKSVRTIHAKSSATQTMRHANPKHFTEYSRTPLEKVISND